MPSQKQLLEAGRNVFEMAEVVGASGRRGYVSTGLTRDGQSYSVFVLDPHLGATVRRIIDLYDSCPCFWDAVEEAARNREAQKRGCAYKKAGICIPPNERQT